MRILVVANDTDISNELERALQAANSPRFAMRVIMDPATALEHLANAEYTLILYYLDEAKTSLTQMARFIGNHLPAPAACLTKAWSPELEEAALRTGAAACLDMNQLLHDLAYTAARSLNMTCRLEQRLHAAEAQSRQEHELRMFYERLAGHSSVAFSQEMQNTGPLRLHSTDTFEHYVQRFADLLELALESHAFKVRYNLTETMQSMSEELGFMRVGPRDLVDIYAAALKAKKDKVGRRKYRALAEEGRMLLLEIMGYMVTFYRKYSFASDGEG